MCLFIVHIMFYPTVYIDLSSALLADISVMS